MLCASVGVSSTMLTMEGWFVFLVHCACIGCVTFVHAICVISLCLFLASSVGVV